MTKDQKARAHLARAQQLLTEQYQDNLGFGTETKESDVRTEVNNYKPETSIGDLPDDQLSIVMRYLENGSLGKTSSLSKKFNILSSHELMKRLQDLATDDQNLINAIQDGDDVMAHLLLKHRTDSPPIDKAAITKKHHAHVIHQILIDALANKIPINLELPDFDANPDPFNITINGHNENGDFRAISCEDSRYSLEIRIVTEYSPMIRYQVIDAPSTSLCKGVLELRATNTD